ncbi:hypothetical protein Tco_0893610 [Tanacetum coccineum]|uniref:Uncharacterized protein n=1 Tax=Tanacetum coccineum TaxID=301880 RepID=A0ABQ5CC48_9ASTR
MAPSGGVTDFYQSQSYREPECGNTGSSLGLILFGDIPTVIPSTSVVAPETSTIAPVISSVAPIAPVTTYNLLLLLNAPPRTRHDNYSYPIREAFLLVDLTDTHLNGRAFLCWCAAPLSTLYPPTTLESSSGDSSKKPLHSSSHSAGPSRKRCKSLVDSIPSSTPVMGSLAPTRADILPPHKRFRDS